MKLGQVTSGAKEKEPVHLHNHAQTNDLEVHDSGTHEHHDSNEG